MQSANTQSTCLGNAAVQAILSHQARGKGLRSVNLWDDSDVMDDSALFEALSDHGLDCSDANERAIEAIVSPLVFGAYYQDGNHPRVSAARAALQAAGYQVAELQWSSIGLQSTCAITQVAIYRAFGYWPMVDGNPVSLEVFEPETREILHSILCQPDQKPEGSPCSIAGYFVIKQPEPEASR